MIYKSLQYQQIHCFGSSVMVAVKPKHVWANWEWNRSWWNCAFVGTV